MKKLPVLLVLTICAVLIGCGKNYYVAPTGEDDNPGTPKQPFKTLQKAADTMEAGDVCFIRGGVYRQTLELSRSGKKNKPIRFSCFEDETVILAGTELVQGNWSVYQENVYQTKVKKTFDQLFVNSQMMVEARWPNRRFPDQLWDRSTWASTGTNSRYGKVVDPALSETHIDWTGAMAMLNVAHQFYTWSRPVTKHEKGSNVFYYEKNLPGITHHADKTTPWEDDKYYLYGKLEALDSPGEWYLDRETLTLYLWTLDGSNPNEHTVSYKVRDYGISGNDIDHVQLVGINLFGCTFRLENCNHCLIDNCHLEFPVYTRELTDLGPEPTPSPSTFLSGNENIIKFSSLAFSPTYGIRIFGSKNLIDNNLIHDFCWNGSLRYTGIHTGPFSEEQSNKEGNIVRYNTVYNAGNACVDITGMPNNIAEYNHIHNGGKACKDVSLLYTHLPVMHGTVFRYNWVHDCHTPHIALGIRGDDQTRNLIVHHNVVWNCDWEAILVKGDSNKVYNNTCLNNGMSDILLYVHGEPKKPWRKQWPLLEKQNQNSEIMNNIAETISGGRYDYVPMDKISSNNYTDQNPMLIDPENFDFRPKQGSPVIDAGKIIPGITDEYIGDAPDIGAYEYGGKNWRAGITWDPDSRSNND